MGKREENRIARFESIHAHSFQIIQSEGVEGLTIQRLSKKMNWALGALYRYYPSKEHLLAALEHEAAERVMAHLLKAQDNSNSPISNIRALAAAYTRLPKELPEEFGLVCLMLGDPRPHLPLEEAQAVMEKVMPFLDHVANLFKSATERGELEIKGPMDATLVFWMTVHGNMLMSKLDRIDNELFCGERLVPLAVEAMLAGWTPQSHHNLQEV